MLLDGTRNLKGKNLRTARTTTRRRIPGCSDQEEINFLTQLNKNLKDCKDNDKAVRLFSDQEVVDFLTQLNKKLKDYKDNDKTVRLFSDQEVVDFLTQLDKNLKDCKDKDKTVRLLTALRAGPPFSWGVTSGGPPGGRSLSKDGTRADSAKDFCRLAGGVIRRKSD